MDKLLFISRWFPYPPDNGSKIRVYNLLRQLSAQFEIHLVSFAGKDEAAPQDLAALHSICKCVYTLPAPAEHRSVMADLHGFFSSRPRSVIATDSKEMRSLITQLMQENVFKLVIASQIATAPYALLGDAGKRILEEVEVSIYTDILRDKKSPFSRLRFWLTYRKYLHYVKNMAARFDGYTVVSEREKAELERLIPCRICLGVIPNGIDLSYYQDPHFMVKRDALIYCGSLTYFANLDAVAYFLAEIFPHILKGNPQAKFFITGKLDGVSLERLPLDRPEYKQAVIFTGYLDDIKTKVAQSWLSVVPLRVGGGTRLKILESLALGTPVVSTSKGAEGLNLVSGRDVLIADRPEEFAAKVLRLMDDHRLRQQLSASGRRAVAAYDWNSIGVQLRDFVQEVISTS